MSALSPPGDGLTKMDIPKKQWTWTRKPFQEVVTEYVPETKLVEQTVMVPVQKVVLRYEVQKIDAAELYTGCSVKLYNLVEAEMNGLQGILEAYDSEKSGWIVGLTTGEKVTVKPDNFIVDQTALGYDGVPIETKSGVITPPHLPCTPRSLEYPITPGIPATLANGGYVAHAGVSPVNPAMVTPPRPLTSVSKTWVLKLQQTLKEFFEEEIPEKQQYHEAWVSTLSSPAVCLTTVEDVSRLHPDDISGLPVPPVVKSRFRSIYEQSKINNQVPVTKQDFLVVGS